MRRILPHAILLALLGAAIALPGTAAGATAHATSPTTTLVRGVFTDSAKYTGTGSVSVTLRRGVRTVRIARDFRADPGSIRLRLRLATTAGGRGAFVDLGPMRETGAQSFRLPRGVSLTRYRYAIAWCAAVDEPITQAKLVRARR